MTEKQLQSAIIEALSWMPNVLVFSVSNGKRGNIRLGVFSKEHPIGFPDILACVAGVFVALEVKLPGRENAGDPGRVRAQAECRAAIVEAGGYAYVVASVDDAVKVCGASADVRKGMRRSCPGCAGGPGRET